MRFKVTDGSGQMIMAVFLPWDQCFKRNIGTRTPIGDFHTRSEERLNHYGREMA